MVVLPKYGIKKIWETPIVTLQASFNYHICSVYRSQDADSTNSSIASLSSIADVKTPTRKGKSAQPTTPANDEDDDEEVDTQGTQTPKILSHNPKTPLVNHNSRKTPDNVESVDTSDPISKEKQKFFKDSAFNAGKKSSRLKEKNDSLLKLEQDKDSMPLDQRKARAATEVKRSGGGAEPAKKSTTNGKLSSDASSVCKRSMRLRTSAKVEEEKPVLRRSGRAEAKKRVEEKVSTDEDESESEEDTSSEECSSSSCESESEDSDSSVESHSDSKIRMQKVVIPSSTPDPKNKTFGGMSVNADKDAPWGFAAAAQGVETRRTARDRTDHKKDVNLFTNPPENPSLFETPPDLSKSDPKPTDDKKGLGQLKGLFDGLSHFFSAPAPSRASRTHPNYNPNKRKTKDEAGKKEPDKIEKDDSKKTPIPIVPPALPHSPSLSPSDLVKSAVNSQRLEKEQLKPIKAEEQVKLGCAADKASSTPTKKRIHQAPAVPPLNTLTGKIVRCLAGGLLAPGEFVFVDFL